MVLKEFEGKIISYPKLCSVLGWNIKKNKKDKENQLESMKEFLDFEEVGKRIKVLKVLDNPKEVDNRKRSKVLKVSKHTDEDLDKMGIYMIKSKNNKKVYIGSTSTSFKKRYAKHSHKSNFCVSKEIVDKEHEFIILESLNCDKEMMIRIENAYIYYYESYTDYEVVNKNNSVKVNRKFKTIRVLENDYEEVMKLLKERGFIS